MENLNRRDFLKITVGLGSVLAGCAREEIVKPPEIIQRTSYKLEDLCDTKVDWRWIKLHIYIEPSGVLWDYHKYNKELFSYVSAFFKENKINCEIIHCDKQFTKFIQPNEFGVEILDSEQDLNDRYFQLITEQDSVDGNPLTLNGRGYAVTRSGIALIDGSWEEFRDWLRAGEITIEEIEEQFLGDYKGIIAGDYLLRVNAGNIVHELLHCMMLFHTRTFKPTQVERYHKGLPNITSYEVPNFKQGHSVGYVLTPLQQKLVHSFIAGNNNYKAFIDSKRDLNIYLENLAYGNNLELNLLK